MRYVNYIVESVQMWWATSSKPQKVAAGAVVLVIALMITGG